MDNLQDEQRALALAKFSDDAWIDFIRRNRKAFELCMIDLLLGENPRAEVYWDETRSEVRLRRIAPEPVLDTSRAEVPPAEPE